LELEIEPTTEVKYITCPICGMSRVLYKSGSTAERSSKKLRKPLGSKPGGRIRFDHMHLDKALLLQARDMAGGRGSGMQLAWGKTLKELKDDADYADLVSQIKIQCRRILAILGGE